MKNLYLWAAALFFLHTVQAQTLTLDPTFGNNGIVEFPIETSAIVDLKPTYAGKILVLAKGGGYQLTRLNQSGSLDSTFAQGGRINFNQIPGYSIDNNGFEDMVSLPNGKILLIGYYLTNPDCNDPYDIGHRICRLNENGTIDTTFGYSGTYSEYTRNIYPKFRFLKNQAGKYIVSVSGSDYTHFLEFDEQGNLNSNIGHFKLNPDLNLKEVIAVTKTNDDLTLALLTYYNYNDNLKTHLQRFLKDGTPDLSFGNAGEILFSDNDVSCSYVSAFTQTRMVFKGTLFSTFQEVLDAFNPQTGNRETTFGVGGIFKFPFSSLTGQGGVSEFLIQNNIDDLGWSAMSLGNYRFEFFLKDANLSPNLAFAPEGHGIWDTPNQLISKIRILAQDNKILVGGEWATNAGHKISLVRLQDENTTSVGAEPEKSPAIFTLQPNPASDFITITGSIPYAHLEIFAANGARVCTLTQPNSQVSVRDLKPGVYFIKLYGKDHNLLEIKKFLKQS